MATKKRKWKILIIDDDAFLLDMYSVKFREEGFDVDIAYNAAEALDKIKEGLTCDIVLLDILMPAMDGFEFLSIVKRDKLLSNAMCVILSNLGQAGEVEKALSLGAVDYIVKAHFTPSEVVKKINSLMAKKEKQ